MDQSIASIFVRVTVDIKCVYMLDTPAQHNAGIVCADMYVT